jgi:hypothetical protein
VSSIDGVPCAESGKFTERRRAGDVVRIWKKKHIGIN